jgi:hypothetical protein
MFLGEAEPQLKSDLVMASTLGNKKAPEAEAAGALGEAEN